MPQAGDGTGRNPDAAQLTDSRTMRMGISYGIYKKAASIRAAARSRAKSRQQSAE